MLPHKGEKKISDSMLDAVQNVLNQAQKPKSIWETGTYTDHAPKVQLPETKKELSEDRIDKLIDSVFSGSDAEALGKAWEDGDAKALEKILASNKIKGGEAKKVIARLLGEAVSVDARTKGFREALKRLEGYKAKRDSLSEVSDENCDKVDDEELEEGKIVKNMRVRHIHNGNIGTVVKGGDKAGGRVEVEWDNGQTTVASGKYLESVKKSMKEEEITEANARDEGAKAAKSGKKKTDNPYKISSEKYAMWNRGFNSISEEEALDNESEVSYNESEIIEGDTELAEAYELFHDKDWGQWGEHENVKFGMKQGYTPVGVVGGLKGTANYFVIFKLNSYDKKELQGVKLKSGEEVFRYSSSATMVGKYLPYVKINLERGLMYFQTQASFDGELDGVEFETRAEKLRFGRVIDSALKEEVEEQEQRDVRMINTLIAGLAEAIDAGKQFDFEAKGELINGLTEEGIKWDRSLLTREHMEKLGVKFDI